MMQSTVYRKEFIFDIDTKMGNEYFGSYRRIYPIIGKYLTTLQERILPPL